MCLHTAHGTRNTEEEKAEGEEQQKQQEQQEQQEPSEFDEEEAPQGGHPAIEGNLCLCYKPSLRLAVQSHTARTSEKPTGSSC